MTCELGMELLHSESPRILAALLPHVPVSCLFPMHALALGAASPSCPLIQPLTQFAFGCFFVAKPTLMDWRTGTFGKPTLKSNVPGS